MLFNSLLFIIFFLPIFFTSFFIVPKKYRYFVLLLGSMVCYFFCGLFNLNLLITIGIINFFIVKLFYNNKYSYFILSILALANIITLFVFKYNHSLFLPLGISFYTFNNIMYIIDVRNKKIDIEKNLFKYLAYITCFAHVTMGPLINYNNIREKLGCLSPSFDDFYNGLQRYIYGLVKKVLIADTLGLLYTNILNINSSTKISCITLLIVFGIQLFIDFSSYSDMAIGLGGMLGMKYPENFDHPYSASSISDFWRRWHITLINFIKNYIYIPLGGNKVSKNRHVFNLFIIWLLTGMWHGNTFNFIIWGLYYFIVQLIEKMYLKNKLKNLPYLVKNIYTLLIVFFGNVFFCTTNIKDSLLLINDIISKPIIDLNILFYIKENIIVLVIGIILCTYIPDKIHEKCDKNIGLNIIYNGILLLLFVLAIIYIVNGSYSPFLYNIF